MGCIIYPLKTVRVLLIYKCNKDTEKNLMRKLLLVTPLVFLMGCQTHYITSDGERLLSNSVVGCAVGQVLFDACAEGAAVAAGATIIDDQTKKLP